MQPSNLGSPMRDEFVKHYDLVSFADSSVNLKREDSKEYREQANRLRTKMEVFINVLPTFATSPLPTTQLMSMPLYTSLDESEPKFDGNLAQSHLQRQLNMRLTTPDESPHISQAFTTWQATQINHVWVHPSGPLFLVAPSWFV